MKFLKKISDFVIYGNNFIALGGASLCWQTYFLLGAEPEILYILLAFLATFFIYNIDRLLAFKSISGVKSERHIWITENVRIMLVLTALSALTLGIMVFFLPFKIILFLAHLGFVSVGYSLPFLGRGNNRRSLRSIKVLKIFLITYVWMAATAWLPALRTDVPFLSAEVQLIALKRALFIFAVTLPFDIRDYYSDMKTDVTTLPQILGMQNSRWLALFCISIFALIAYIQFYPNYLEAFYSLQITALVSALLIWYATPKRHEYYYTAALDGTLILQMVLLLLFHWLM